MIRFAWLQSRTQTLTVAAALAALAIASAITGVQLSHLYDSSVAHCHTGCGLATDDFLSRDSFMGRAFDLVARAAPALIGMFWGATLLGRELETGTYRLAWTQSVTRSRWLITKLAVGGLATVIAAGVLTLTITWWYRAQDRVGATPYSVFDSRDIAPIGYAAFAFALGALLGAVIRRTVPAMAATLGVFVGARVTITTWVRPHLLSPLHAAMPLQGPGPSVTVQIGDGSQLPGGVSLLTRASAPANSWPLSSHLVTGSGRRPSSAQLTAFFHQYCPSITAPPASIHPGQGPSPAVMQACLDRVAQSFHVLVAYQPESRFWTFQLLETGIFVALAVLAAAACYWWVTRRTN